MSVIVNGMFSIKIPYDPECVVALGKIAGRRYDAVNRMWWFPTNALYEVADAVASRFPNIASRLEGHQRYAEVRNTVASATKSTGLAIDIDTSGFDVPCPKSLNYFGYQKAGIKFAYSLLEQGAGGCIIGDDMGCISGNALVTVRIGGASRKIPLSMAFMKWKQHPDSMYIRGLKDGRFHQLPVAKILDKGVRRTVRVTTSSGRTLVCTPDHELFIEAGTWLRADETLGASVAVNGKPQCKRCGSTEGIVTYKYTKYRGFCKNCAYMLRRNRNDREAEAYTSKRDGYVYLRGRYFIDHPRYTTGGLLEHVYVAEQWLKRPLCDGEEVHHINRDRADNRPENLMVMSKAAHARAHSRENNFGSSYRHHSGNEVVIVPKYEEVVSVEECGEEHVYDVVVADDAHNFVADGFVVHNCGKTVQFLGLVNKALETAKTFPKTLIICPSSLKLNWERMCRMWLVRRASVAVIDPNTSSTAIATNNIVIINYDILRKMESALIKVKWDFICMDEAHYIKNRGAKRSAVARKIAHNIVSRKGAQGKRAFLVEMTGTPIVNRPSELWHLLHCIDPATWKSFDRFRNRYSKGHYGVYGFVETGIKNSEELQSILRGSYMIRRLKSDVLSELPPKRRQIVELGRHGYESVLDNEAKVRNAFDKAMSRDGSIDDKLQEAIRNDDLANIEEYKRQLNMMDSSFSAEMRASIAKVRHETALAKVPRCCEFIDTILEEKDKVVVFAHHRDVIEAIADHYKNESAILYGGMSAADKDEAVQKFKNSKRCKVFVISIAAGGVGLTLTEADTVVFCELDWSPSNNTQAEDRCFAAGTPILTPTGYREIETIRVGDYVIGGDGKAHVVTDAWEHVTDKPLVNVHVWGGFSLTCTSDHLFKLRDGTWKEARRLKKGDYIAQIDTADTMPPYTTPISIPEEMRIPDTFVNGFGKTQRNGRAKHIPDIEIDADFLFVCGYYLGDGFASCGSDKGGFIDFSGNTTTKVEALNRCAKWAQRYGVKVTYARKGGTSKCAGIRCYSKELGRLFTHMFGHGAKNKHFADWMFNLNSEQLSHVIDGLRSSDGYVRKGTQQLSYATSSNALASNVMWALMRAGYIAGISCVHNDGKGNVHRASVPCHDDNITYYPGAVISRESNYRIRCNKVRNVTPVNSTGNNRVYDITVDGVHTFVAGSCVVHNCHRIGQKSCVFVYHVVIQGSIDAYIAQMNIRKQDIIDKALAAPSKQLSAGTCQRFARKGA